MNSLQSNITSEKSRITTLLLVSVLLLCVAASGTQQHADQVEYDPQTGKWVTVAAPAPGTPEGDLAAARRLLADGDASKARRRFGKWLKNYGQDHPLAREAYLGLAEAELNRENYYKAHVILSNLAAEFGTDDVTRKAVDWEFVIAEVFLSGKKRKWLGMRILPARDIGIQILDGISANYPDTDLAEAAIKTRADYYFDRGDFDLAEDEYGRLISSFPRSRWLLWANLRRAQAALGRFPGTAFDDASLVEAEERFLRFRTDFPQGATQWNVDGVLEDIRNTRAQKEFEIGQYYAKTGRAPAAAFYYHSVMTNWPDTIAAVRAEAALSDMGQLAPGVDRNDNRIGGLIDTSADGRS